MLNKSKLALGTKLHYDGEVWKVEGFQEGSLQMRSGRGKLTIIGIGALIGAPGFAFMDADAAEADAAREVTFADNVPPEAISAARTLLEHLNEMETGYKSGYRGSALKHEPRPEYDPSETTARQRAKSKSEELKIGFRTLWTHKSEYKRYGIYGLIDQRLVRLSMSKIDVRVVDALHEVVKGLVNSSNKTNESIVRQIRKLLKLKYPEHEVEVPSRATMNRLITRETKNKGLKGSAKGRRSINNGPETTYRKFYATRPGEMVLIDSTPLDAFAMDPVSYRWLPIQLTVALDLFTRSIVAWRFTPVSTKGVDAALLLYDIVRPKAMLKGWPEFARWSYVGVPEHVVVEIAQNSGNFDFAAIPFVLPDSIVSDHGKVFISQTFKDGCSRLGTNLQLARPYTPTDKSHVERVFKTIRENFVMELPGYKGPDVFSRGLDPQGEAFYFIDEIEEKFAVWVAAWWQRRHHDGLDLPTLPYINMSPNEMYEEGIARAGFVHLVSTENLFFELLPTAWRTIQSYGVEFRGLRYDGDVLNDFRHETSPYNGLNAGKWPIRYDPRDLSIAYFYDHVDNSWHQLAWCHSEGTDRPFNESVLGYAKALVVTRQGNVNNADELSETLNSLLDDMHVSDTDRTMRRMIAVNAVHSQLAAKDRGRQPQVGPAREAVTTDSEIPHSAWKTPPTVKSTEETYFRLLDVNEALENDDDDLGY